MRIINTTISTYMYLFNVNFFYSHVRYFVGLGCDLILMGKVKKIETIMDGVIDLDSSQAKYYLFMMSVIYARYNYWLRTVPAK